jgi:hypothetical protein
MLRGLALPRLAANRRDPAIHWQSHRTLQLRPPRGGNAGSFPSSVVFSAPNNRVRSRKTVAEPRLTAL